MWYLFRDLVNHININGIYVQNLKVPFPFYMLQIRTGKRKGERERERERQREKK